MFFAEILHTFPSYQCLQIGVWDLFIFFKSWVIDKPDFCERAETRSVLILANNLSSTQKKKNPTQKNPFL